MPNLDVIREEGLEAMMPDGVRLIADVWRPATGGPWPALLQRLPYGRSVASMVVLPHPTWFARRGYVVAVQDVRGTGGSEGEFVPFLHEARDGAVSIEWLTGLPCCDGNVGMYGFSYQGMCQLYAAALRPPSLRAIAPMMCAADPYDGWMYEGGCLRWAFAATWAGQLAGLTSRGRHLATVDLEAVPMAAALGSSPPEWFVQWLDHPDDDGYWAERRPDLAAIEVPALSVVGWFDDFSSATARLAGRLQAETIFGPWAHFPWGTRFGNFELGGIASPASAYRALAVFFDRHLKGEGESPVAPIRYFAGGAGWKTSASWPPSDRKERWTATSRGNANSRHGDGRLVLGEAEPGPPDVIVSEPLVPFPVDELPLQSVAAAEDRRDVLCYTSDPLPADMDVAGSAVVTVRTRCDCKTYDLVVWLVLIDLDGEPRTLAYGARKVQAPPRTEVSVGIELRPIAWRFPRRSHLRLDVAPARFPALARNPHVPGLAARLNRTKYRIATIELLDLRLDLPVE